MFKSIIIDCNKILQKIIIVQVKLSCIIYFINLYFVLICISPDPRKGGMWKTENI